jgi:hypothetical protein
MLITATAVAVGGCGGAGPAGTADRAGTEGGRPPAVRADPLTASPAGRPAAVPGTSRAQVADPVRLRIPDIGVAAAVVPLGLGAGGRLEAPTEWSETGWNRAGPEPGEVGTAVVAGHVDSRSGPAVFYRLRELRPGARVHVDRADGSTAAFVVDRLVAYRKDAVPAEAYRDTGRVELRLVTCGGTVDHARGSYRDNLVVYAHAG